MNTTIFEIIDDEHVRLNGWLLDLTLLEWWIDHSSPNKQGAGHLRPWLEKIRRRVAEIIHQRDHGGSSNIEVLVHDIQMQLMGLSNCGFDVPDEAFRNSWRPFYRWIIDGKESGVTDTRFRRNTLIGLESIVNARLAIREI